MKAVVNKEGGIMKAPSGYPVMTWETEKERKKLMAVGKSKRFIRNPDRRQASGSHIVNNRAVTPGRRYSFVAVMKRIGSAMHAIKRRLEPTGRFRKIFTSK